jgi:hypothetical protein
MRAAVLAQEVPKPAQNAFTLQGEMVVQRRRCKDKGDGGHLLNQEVDEPEQQEICHISYGEFFLAAGLSPSVAWS